jgi:hypothetical protein
VGHAGELKWGWGCGQGFSEETGWGTYAIMA